MGIITTEIRAPLIGECWEPAAAGSERTGLIIVPSSAGVTDVRERAYARFFAEQGMVCAIPDPFRMLGVAQCLTSQISVPASVMLRAARDTHALLAVRDDVARVGIMGVSKGGLVALHAAMRPMPGSPPFDGYFAFHLCLAPPVSVQLRHPHATGAPILMLIGEYDDFTPAAPGMAYAQRIREANPGLTLECHIVPGAHHAWEARGRLQHLATAECYAHCLFYLEDDGAYTDMRTGRRYSAEDFMASLPSHAMYGAHAGGGSDALFEQTCRRLLSFITARVGLSSRAEGDGRHGEA